MEQWILDGRSLVRQRDPAKARPSEMVVATLQEGSSVPLCATSKLLGGAYARVSPRDANKVEYCFATDRGAVWDEGFDYSGVHGLIRQGAKPTEHEVPSDALPKPYAEVTCNLSWYSNGVLADTLRGFEFVAGAGVVPQAAEEAALHTPVGQTSVFLCDPAFAFREDGLQPRMSTLGAASPGVPSEGVVTLEITVVEFRNALSEAEKIAEAEALKGKGNAAMADKDFAGASAEYRKGLSRLASGVTQSASRETLDAGRKLKATLLHNLAAAIMGADAISATAAEQAAGHCTRALAIDAAYAKARFRRALAYLQARKLDLADADARHLRDHGEGDPAAVAQLFESIAAARSGRL